MFVRSNNAIHPKGIQWAKFAVGMMAAFAFGAILLHIDPAATSFYPPCLFHALTNLHCPGCGTLRSLHQLLNGNVATAFGLNPLTISLLPFLGYAFLSYVMRLLKIKAMPEIFIPAIWIWIFLGLVILFTVLRNIPTYPFVLLAP